MLKPSTRKLQSIIKKRGRMTGSQRLQASELVRGLRKSGHKRQVRDYYYRFGSFGK